MNTGMSDLNIIFQCHLPLDNEVVRRNLDSFRRHNSSATIHVLNVEKIDAWQKAVALNEEKPRNRWHDIAVFHWIQATQRPSSQRRWLLIEWDTYATCPADEYYCAVWDAPLAGVRILYPNRDQEWVHFHAIHQLPAELQPHAAGISPATCLFMRDDVVWQYADYFTCRDWWARASNVNDELRLGSVAAYLGIPLAPIPRDTRFITWQDMMMSAGVIERNGLRGLWHPVKR
jgi:hypothetical protein